ncbi:MAG TPA: bacillithiol biosynthesis cysteine-adding enzyme BshC, partial [Aggregicoccus sp.]|nr:bacillithiol biosynthesis cysteine-adding enzyme BshC [Aggregicoccus sp.]
MTSSFSAAWLRGEPRARAFLPDAFRSPAERAQAVARAAERSVAPALVDALARQGARLAPSPERERQLERLSRPGSVAVVTGQQVGLFLGPLYTLYKAASAIAAARALEQETGRPCVPVFWLQTEDHDLPEIEHCTVPASHGGLLRLGLGLGDAATSRVPVAYRHLGAGVTTALAELREVLGEEPHAGEHLALLAQAYRPQATLPEAFAQVLSSVFAEEGLLFLDPRDAALAPLAAPVHRRALEQAEPLARALQARSEALAAAGFDEQVPVRAGAPLSFFSPEGAEGERYRLVPTDSAGTWRLAGHPAGLQVTRGELLGLLEREPRRFTTSALLRPLLQDTLLPTAAYVGGPGELAYFAQLQPLYTHAGLPTPLAVPRARFRVVDDRARRLLSRLGLSAEEACAPQEALLPRLCARDAEPPAQLEARLTQAFAPELARLGERMAALDPGFARPLERTQRGMRKAVAKLA